MIDQARTRIDRWKSSLIEGTRGLEGGLDPLLELHDGPTCLPLPGVDPLSFATALGSGGAFAFEAGMDPGVETGWLRIPLPTSDLERRLTLMRRAARRARTARGEHVLWIALGALVWQTAEGSDRTSPLALWPVELERTASRSARLVAVEGIEPRINAALVVALEREASVVLAAPDAVDGAPLDIAGLFAAAEGLAVTRPAWRVERMAKLGVFSFARFSIAADLALGGETLATHSLVAHLAASDADSRTPFAQPSIAAAETVTRPSASDDMVAPLDADASQLAAVNAAAQGATFVLQAPPGTGATQTIANLVVHAAAHGKSVLVVGEMPAALDAIQQRLGSVGLAELCVPLYGAAGTRDRVVAQLARVVERTFRPGVGSTTGAGLDTRLVELRHQLDGHVAALHAIGPFGRSLHDVLGRLVELRTAPNAVLAERDAVGLDGATFEKRRAAVTALADAALPVEPVATHAWRLSTLESAPAGLREHALAALDETASAADVLAGGVRELSHLVPNLVAKTREQLSALGALAMVAAVSPRPGAELLTNMRGGKGEDIDERVALIRARGAGTVEVPRDPLAFLALAHKHRALTTEVEDHFTHSVENLDAGALWTQLRKWTNSMAPLRFVALRAARAEVKSAAMPTHLETDESMISALEAVIAERACRAALLAAAEPAKRWFGEVGGDPLTLDLGKLDDAVSWSAELRRAFDALDVIGGAAGRESAWRALVAQVAANPETSSSTTVERSATKTGAVAVLAAPATTEPGAALATATNDAVIAGAATAKVDADASAVVAGLAIDAPIFAKLAEAVTRWSPALAALGDATGIPAATLATGDDHLVSLRERIDALRHAVDALPAWVAFHAARRAALAAGVGPAVAAIERGDLGASELASAWERATLLAWADAELSERPALSHFHGASHHAQAAAFADLDRGALALSRARALAKLASFAPRVSQDPTGELAVLVAEAKAPKKSLRSLLSALPTVRARIAPCVLATPQAVSELLEPTAMFDIVVIRDAEQVATAAAIGAIGRGTATVIVGDRARAIRSDSLLAECASLPELSLAWHYRSKHEDLFALANQRVYDDRLQVLPLAHATMELGVTLRGLVSTFDPDAQVNRAEAEAVVADVLARLRDPAQRTRSIGVVVMTSAQRELIEDLLDEARGEDPSLDAILDPAELGPDAAVEPLTITVLGESARSRDIILLAITYAPSELGALAIEHGPLAEPGGERALLSATTRAREQLLVFSSIAPEDLPIDSRAAVRELAAFMSFARQGGNVVRRVEDAPPASPITDAIARALGERGWTLRHQVGVGPFKLDLAVVDPNDPERFVLAIEHDGAAYATSRVARDRDRLRPQTLVQLGWRLHRVWGLDWWADPEREIQRAHGAIVTAIAATRQRRTPVVTKPPRTVRPSTPATPSAQGSAPIVRIPPKAATSEPAVLASGSGPTLATPLAAYDGPTTPTRVGRNAIPIGPYTAAAIPAGRRTPDDLFAPRYLGEVQKIVEQVLAAEAPMHVDLLARRVGGYFGIGRLSQRVSDQICLALEGRGKFGDEDKIVWRLDQDPACVPAVRVAGQQATARRAIDEVPLSELASAARIVVERAGGITTPELVRDSARLLGFARVTDQVTERVTLGVRLAIARELIRISDNKALLPLD